jgi:hypothetical protein
VSAPEAIPPEARQAGHARAAVYYRGHDPILWANHALHTDYAAEASRAAAGAANAMIAARRFAAAYP